MDEPVTAMAKALRARVSEATWSKRVEVAQHRAETLTAIRQHYQEYTSWRACVRAIAPSWTWSQFLHLERRATANDCPLWENLLDRRVPPVPKPLDDDVRLLAEALRRVDRSIGCPAVRQRLTQDFGERGNISDSTLKRVFAEANLHWVAPPPKPTVVTTEPETKVDRYGGGGGLALLAAAATETGVFDLLAEAVQQQANALPPAPEVPFEPAEGPRDERGRFTPDYNTHYREGVGPGAVDSRWDPDAAKRQRRDLGAMQLWGLGAPAIAHRMMAIGLTPLLTRSRGFDGLCGVAGGWLELMGIHPYLPTTLDKTLAELALADVVAPLWATYGRTWFALSRPWCAEGEPWLQAVAYVDATQDPYWTARFAKSGRVSRTGRVQPCLSRIVITSGPGVPIIVETVAGTAVLTRRLLSLLDEMDEVLGEGELGRLTIIDAEMAIVSILDELALHAGRGFVTVIKGSTLKGATLTERGPWQSYRDHDTIREVEVVLKGSRLPAKGKALRGVQMTRTGSRHPVVTTFVTDQSAEELPTEAVADAYLSRWPHQEQIFRNGRNGGGLNRSHGFGGQEVSHIAQETKQTKAQRRLDRTRSQVAEAKQALADPALAEPVRKLLKATLTSAERAEQRAQKEVERYATHPTTIYERDTNRDSIVTALTMTALMLLQFVLREYFASGPPIQYQTFIEQLIALPVTVAATKTCIHYRIERNHRNPKLMSRLQEACQRINDRKIKRGDQQLVFELIEHPPP